MTRFAVRDELVDQVEYLIDELHAQEAILSFVPEPLWRATLPTGEPSLLELYGLLAGLSERSYPGLLEAWADAGPAEVQSIDEDDLRDAEPWNEAAPHGLISRIVEARAGLVARLQAIAGDRWREPRTVDGQALTLADVAWRITQEDALILRHIAERLHDANLGGSPVTPLH